MGVFNDMEFDRESYDREDPKARNYQRMIEEILRLDKTQKLTDLYRKDYVSICGLYGSIVKKNENNINDNNVEEMDWSYSLDDEERRGR